MYLNKVTLYGNLTRDPEAKALPSGQMVTNFSLATNRVYKDKNGAKQEMVEYHNVVAFGRTAEVIAQYLKKGRPIFVEGRLQTRTWEKDGAKQYRTEIIVETFQFGPNGSGEGMSAGNSSAAAASHPAEASQEAPDFGSGEQIQYPEEEINPEDIPF